MAGGTYSRQENGPALSHPLNLLGVIYLGEPPSVPPPESLALGHNKEGGKATGGGGGSPRLGGTPNMAVSWTLAPLPLYPWGFLSL